ERMSLGDQRQPWACTFGEFGQTVAECGAVLDRTEIAADAWAEAVPELIDCPQIDASSVQREAVPVVEAGVLAEAMQEDDGCAWLGGGPVPVVGAAFGVI